MVFQILLAGRTIEICSMGDQIYNTCYPYLLSPGNDIHPTISVSVTAAGLRNEKAEARRLEDQRGAAGHQYRFDSQLETMAVYRQICEAMPAFDTFLMHGSVVSCDGEGYMFTAPSGMGKTTRALCFLEEFPGSIVVNGDKPLLKVTDDAVIAYGTPWCGKENLNTNTSVPLRAIFLVERAEDGEQDAVTELTFSQAFPVLLQQTYRPADPEAMKKTLRLLAAMRGKTRFFRCRTAPTREAMRLAWETAQAQAADS